MSDNREQIDYWNGEAGTTWVEAQARLDRMLAPISEAVLERADARAGEQVLDVGCGCGDTTLALAAAGARVRGIDISEPMLARARERARQAGVDSVRFEQIDAAFHGFEAEHQLLFSRFGVMFFADPAAAFANLRRALTDDGRLCFVCWQAPRENPWMAIAGRAVQPFLPEAEPPDPLAPGPFAFADPDRVRMLLVDAGFTGVDIDPLRPTLHLADTLDEAVEFQQQVGPLARALAELEGETREAAIAAAREALEPHLGPDGLRLGGACWVVTATAG
ncbi:MAG: methyltransferase domain-containing protein [Gammaproteobacteria bacterium]|nr:methyltransferase domain-containing protein [Gammaproteobacteria bacterium]